MARPTYIKIGLGLFLISILIGVIPTVIGMTQTFNAMGADQTVSAETLSESIGTSMMWTTLAIPVAVAGLVLFICGLVLKPPADTD